MFGVRCQCGAEVSLERAQLNQPLQCASCQTPVMCLTGEMLDEAAAAAADFDASILITKGPQYIGQLILLGGCAPIPIGKQETNLVILPGVKVSRRHCQLTRIDFGPSRWRIDDNQSRHGLFVNGARITSHELQNGDIIQVGEYELQYKLIEAPIELPASAVVLAPVARPRTTTSIAAKAKQHSEPVIHTTGVECPSCRKKLGPSAKICIDCGVHAPSGRPLLTSNDLDENVVYGNADTILRFISWLVWVTPLPMPLASTAYGKHKPYAIWAISALTVVVSLIFFIAVQIDSNTPAQSLMLWPTVDLKAYAERKIEKNPDALEKINRKLTQEGEKPMSREEFRDLIVQEASAKVQPFHWYQPFTCALLHDPNGIFGFILHLGGNMLFMIVFGSRVNAIIGNGPTAIIYPILALASSLTFMFTLPAGAMTPLLGASGAINGLAGMYLVLFPLHRVYCAMWIRVRFYLFYKIFVLRGFWILLIYFAYDALNVAVGIQGHTAHWAHIGGFITGVAIAIAILASRKFDCRNGDLLSVILGKHAWPLIGKPRPIDRSIVTA